MSEKKNFTYMDMGEDGLFQSNKKIMKALLFDNSTGKNIRWATDNYSKTGISFEEEKEIKADLITGWYKGLIMPRAEKDLKTRIERTRNKAEVFTPSWIIKKQVDTVVDEMRDLSLLDFINSRWLELACGEAPYMANRYDMLTGEIISLEKRSGFIDEKFRRLNSQVKNKKDWIDLAKNIYKSSYGYEYQGDSLLLARQNLLLTFIDNYFYMFGEFPKDSLLLTITKIISENVFQMDGLTYQVPYSKDKNTSQQLSMLEELLVEEKKPMLAKINLWHLDKKVNFIDIVEESEREMKFDVVIGNPPYQKSAQGTSTSDDPIYHLFMDESYKISKKSILITPGRFLFNAGKTPKSWNKKMLEDDNLKILYYNQKSFEIFSNTDIKGGIAVTYRDSSRIFGKIDLFIPFNELSSIYRKVLDDNFRSIQEIIYNQNKFYLDILYEDYPNYKRIIGSNGKDKRLDKPIFSRLDVFRETGTKEDFKILGIYNLKRAYRFINKKYIEDNGNIYCWKVILPVSNGSGALGEVLSTPLIGEPLIGEPLIGYTRSFIGFGNFDNKLQAENLLKYIKSKFSRVMLGILKITQDNTFDKWKYVPLQDFTSSSDIDWTKSIPEIDQQLYKKYKLSQEEIDFIEKNVREMI